MKSSQLFMTLLFRALSLCAVLFFLGFPGAAHAQNGARLRVLDTVAGFETLLRGSGFAPDEPVTFTLQKPDGSSVQISAESDGFGDISLTIGSRYISTAGKYIARVQDDVRKNAYFEVYAADMSVEKSTISSPTQKGEVRKPIPIVVTILDEFKNPLPLHEVSVTSSRSKDRIEVIRNRTDIDGNARFTVTPQDGGTLVITATDETSGNTLDQRFTLSVASAKIPLSLADIGGDAILLAQANEISQNVTQVAEFLIENLPATTNTNDSLNFRIRAVDGSSQVVTGYLGTVHFISTDPNVQVPTPYTFKDSDRGEKTFDLGLRFGTAGEQSLIVEDVDDPGISGRVTVTVINPNASQSSDVRITKPAPGTYSINSIEIAGQSHPHANIIIFDNNQQIGEVQSTSNGRYSFKTSLLSDGQHVFHVESGTSKSTSVTVTIDSTPAQVEHVEIEKTFLGPAEETGIIVRSDSDLKSIQAIVGDFIEDLVPDGNRGTYRGTIVAPAQEGDHIVTLILTDASGNVSDAIEAGTITVDSSAGRSGSLSFLIPGKVTDVQITPGPGQASITWSPAPSQNGIALYRIYYGTDPNNLDTVINTRDGATSWIVSDLNPEFDGQTFYFQIVGVDNEGNEGDNLSDVSEVNIASFIDGNNTSGGLGNGENGQETFYIDDVTLQCSPGPCPRSQLPPYTPDDGPEIFGVILTAFFTSAGYRKLRIWGNHKKRLSK